LIQEQENDVDLTAPMITASIVDVPTITAFNGAPDTQIAASDICESSCITSNISVDMTEVDLISLSEETCENISKPRTALFKEGEDDEPMAPQNISTEIPNMVIGLKFGAIIFDEKYSKNMDKFTVVGLSSNIIIGGATFMKGENMKSRKYIYVGSMKVDMT
jgi:hypothetical protein